jgi:hypothetical protein
MRRTPNVMPSVDWSRVPAQMWYYGLMKIQTCVCLKTLYWCGASDSTGGWCYCTTYVHVSGIMLLAFLSLRGTVTCSSLRWWSLDEVTWILIRFFLITSWRFIAVTHYSSFCLVELHFIIFKIIWRGIRKSDACYSFMSVLNFATCLYPLDFVARMLKIILVI